VSVRFSAAALRLARRNRSSGRRTVVRMQQRRPADTYMSTTGQSQFASMLEPCPQLHATMTP
jgi:hypothetical protein